MWTGTETSCVAESTAAATAAQRENKQISVVFILGEELWLQETWSLERGEVESLAKEIPVFIPCAV